MAIVNETLIEMYFFKAVRDYFVRILGADCLRILKPSQQREAWVGFDEGFVKSIITEDALLDQIEDNIHQQEYDQNIYEGFFFQYKIVDRISKRTKYAPPNYRAPYYRAELDLKINDNTHHSQHEILVNLSRINNAFVCYACGMVFTRDQLLFEDPSLHNLRLVPILPRLYPQNERHFIAFQSPNDRDPIWNSEPIVGKSFTLLDKDIEEKSELFRPFSAAEIKEFITGTRNELDRMTKYQHRKKLPYPEAMTIMEFAPKRK